MEERRGMPPAGLEALFAKLRVGGGRDRTALHKPLLVLWAIGRCLAGRNQLTPYREVEAELRDLWRRFGPPRALNTVYPFWRLQKDGVWEVPGSEGIRPNTKGDVSPLDLDRINARGGFPPAIHAALRQNPALALRIAHLLVEMHFPATRHEPVLRAVGLGPEVVPFDESMPPDESTRYETIRRRRRQWAFSGRVLKAYGHRCAVCKFSLRLEDQPLALEAAHIKWHSHRGPDEVHNGLALCVLHHRLFDAGAFTLTPEHEIVVVAPLKGHGFVETLGLYDKKPAQLPTREENKPDPEFLEWHHREVFRAPERVGAGAGRRS